MKTPQEAVALLRYARGSGDMALETLAELYTLVTRRAAALRKEVREAGSLTPEEQEQFIQHAMECEQRGVAYSNAMRLIQIRKGGA